MGDEGRAHHTPEFPPAGGGRGATIGGSEWFFPGSSGATTRITVTEQSAVKSLPEYRPERLTQFDAAVLADLLHLHEDRLPLTVIDECARRGDEMTKLLADLAVDGSYWREDTSSGEWWALFHAAMVLGKIPGEPAGDALVAMMRRMDAADDENLQEWLDGAWPALFANKAAPNFAALRDLARDRKVNWYMRLQALDTVIADAERRGEGDLESALDWVAGFAADETDDWDLRLLCATTLLAFPRERHRPLLEELARRQSRREAAFTREELDAAYAGQPRVPDWRERADPWGFYDPVHIAERQQRWAEVAKEEDAEPVVATYTREAPKVGRNDPCPCGSGKKYKKCCLGTEPVH